MINPLEALSSLQSAASSAGVNFQPTGPTTPGSAIGEGFNNMLQSTQNALTPQAASSISPLGAGGGSPTNWGHMVQQMVMDVNSQQQSAAQKVTDVLKGGPTPVHDAMVASEEASLSFEFLSEMRNKLVESYQQVMQMQV
jgi:flagellar hook-basal body complex protein FliE